MHQKIFSKIVLLSLVSCAIKPIKRDLPTNYNNSLPSETTSYESQGNYQNEGLELEKDDHSQIRSQSISLREETPIQIQQERENTESLNSQMDPNFLTHSSENQKVQNWIKYFTEKDHERFQRFINKGYMYKNDIEQILSALKVPKDLFFVGLIESGYSLKIQSHAGAVGPWQFVRSAAKDYGLRVNTVIDERRDLYKATEAAGLYFKDLYNIFGSWELALSAYNAGPSRIIYQIRKHNTRDFSDLSAKKSFPKETANYVPKIVAVRTILSNPSKYGFIIPRIESPFKDTTQVSLKYSLNLKDVSKKTNISVTELKKLNPELKGDYTPYQKISAYKLRVYNTPKVYASMGALKYFKGNRPYGHRVASSSKRSLHKVRSGENLSVIARKYGLSLRELKRINKLSTSKIRAGQKLKVSKVRTSKSTNSKSRTHKVRRGENLSLIARKYKTNVKSIMSLNGFKNQKIFPGQKIKVKGRSISSSNKNSRRYTVKKGDNLYQIAKRHNKSLKSLMRLNNLRSGKVFPGQKLKL